MSAANVKSALSMIEGKELVSVCFVLDYIEFLFGDVIFTALAEPILFQAGQGHSLEQPGFRDALCAQIKKSVRETAENDRLLAITLDDGAKLVIPLDSPSYDGPEMATLSGKGAFYAAWIRPD
jgi:hypothetical protein